MKRQINILFFLSFFSLPSVAIAQEGKPFQRHEIAVQASFFTPDTLRSVTAYGGSYSFKFNNEWWASAEFVYGTINLDSGEALNFDDTDQMIMVNVGPVFNAPILLGVTLDSWKGDFYTSVGYSYLRFGSETTHGGYIGGGLTVHTPIHWLGLRADLKNIFYNLDNPNGGGFNSDLNLSLGVTFFL